MSNSDFEDYRSSVRAAISGDDERAVLNGSLKHAQIVIEEAFRAASQRVRILSNSLDGGCYDSPSVLALVKDFLARAGTSLSILVETPISEIQSGIFYKTFEAEIQSGKIDLAYVPSAISKDYGFNFLVVDERSYRFEADRRKPEAVVLGGAHAALPAQRLARLFDSLQARVVGPADAVLL